MPENLDFHWDKDNNIIEMDIQLIDGQFSEKDALKILTEIIHVNIRFHENKIKEQPSQNDINHHENQIKQLQKNLFEVSDLIRYSNKSINLKSSIGIK